MTSVKKGDNSSHDSVSHENSLQEREGEIFVKFMMMAQARMAVQNIRN